MLPVIILITALFALFFLIRLGGAQRREVMRRWPALVLAGAALFALARGGLTTAAALGVAAGLAWELAPRLLKRRSPTAKPSPPDPADVEARAILGVSENATASEIRTAYRTKMAQAHPDRGGSHNEAARLTAARDRLLGKKR